jgi:alpha-ketoglutarate-dependent taurine dioxygenase
MRGGQLKAHVSIKVEPISPVIGAEISGVDLSQPLSDQTFQEIHDALMKHRVVFFRNQDLTLNQHKDFGRHFGELHVHPAAPEPQRPLRSDKRACGCGFKMGGGRDLAQRRYL